MYIHRVSLYSAHEGKTHVLAGAEGAVQSQKIIRQLLCRALLKARCAVYFSWRWKRFGSVVSKTTPVT